MEAGDNPGQRGFPCPEQIISASTAARKRKMIMFKKEYDTTRADLPQLVATGSRDYSITDGDEVLGTISTETYPNGDTAYWLFSENVTLRGVRLAKLNEGLDKLNVTPLEYDL